MPGSIGWKVSTFNHGMNAAGQRLLPSVPLGCLGEAPAPWQRMRDEGRGRVRQGDSPTHYFNAGHIGTFLGRIRSAFERSPASIRDADATTSIFEPRSSTVSICTVASP